MGDKNVHERSLTLGVLLFACAVQAGLLPGCSEGRSTADSQALMEETAKAQRRYAKASALWANPVYKYKSGDNVELISPLPPGTIIPDSDTNKVQVLPASAMNPKVLDVLKEAASALKKAISRCAAADDATKALAEATLGRIVMLRGEYHAAKTASQRQAARYAADRIREAVQILNAQLNRIEYYDLLSQVSNDDLNEIIKQSKDQQAAIKKQISDIDAKIAEKTKARNALSVATSNLRAQAGKLRTDSRLASGREGLNLLEKALAKEKVAGRNEANIARYDYDISSLKTQKKDLELKGQSAKARQESAEKIAAARNEVGDTNARQKDLVTKELDKPYLQVEHNAEKLSDALGMAKKHEKDALDAFESASTHLRLAANLEAKVARSGSTSPRPESSASAGEADMLAARMCVDQLAMRALAQDIASELKTLWTLMGKRDGKLPNLAGKIASYVSDPTKVATSAEKSFNSAIKVFDQAVRYAGVNNSWTYEGQLAVAYAGLYNLYQMRIDGMKRSGSADQKIMDELTQRAATARDSAMKTCDAALKDKENSPYLRHIRRLKYLLD